MPTITGAHHVAFTVHDVDANAAWYQDLFGMQVVMQTDDETVRLRILVHPECGWVIHLREYPAHADGTFSEFRTGPIADSPLGALMALRAPGQHPA